MAKIRWSVLVSGAGLCAAAGALLAGCTSGSGKAAANTDVKFADVNTVGHDREVWQKLLDDHAMVRRTAVYTATGVEATTESDDPAVAGRIREHAKAMQTRVRAGAPVRVWDGVFADLFAKHEVVRLEVAPMEKGVKIVESSDDPVVVATLWSHAAGVCEFVREGHDAGARATRRVANGTMPASEMAIGGVRNKLLLGQPEAKQLRDLRAAGVKVLVNFRKPSETPGFDEASAAETAGMSYVNLPYAGAGELTDAILDAVRARLRDAEAAGEMVALHCRSGNRVGPAWAVYRTLDCGVDVERAIGEARAGGMKDPALEAKVREYIRQKQ